MPANASASRDSYPASSISLLFRNRLGPDNQLFVLCFGCALSAIDKIEVQG